MIQVLMAASFGYLVGSIPFGFLLTKLAGLGDIRAVGSGSIGATNVLRTGRKGLAAATVVLDVLKGTVAVLVAARSDDAWVPLVAGFAVVLGHCTTIWMGGRGGKGVATGLGVILGWAWPVGVALAVVWLGVLAATRISSAGGLVAAGLAPVLMLVVRPWEMGLATLCVAGLIVVRHHQNIGRLWAGTEPRVGRR